MVMFVTFSVNPNGMVLTFSLWSLKAGDEINLNFLEGVIRMVD
jgi:hypothetical protein